MATWLNVRTGLAKADPITQVEVLRKPIFGNPLIINTAKNPLGINGLSEGSAFAKSGCSRLRDL
jgi:hypothetical protein